MKPVMFYPKPLVFGMVCALFLISTSCDQTSNPGTYRNENITKSVREKIQKLNFQIVSHLRRGDKAALRAMMSDELLDATMETLPKFVARAEKTIKSKQYTTIDIFYRISEEEAETNVFISGTESDDDYIIPFQSITKESVVAVIVPDREDDRYLLTAIYGRFDGFWKLTVLQYDRYTIGGLSAPELYREAQKEVEAGRLINGINRMVLANGCMKPAGDYWKFRLEDEMIEFSQSLTAQAQEKYPVPFKVESIPTNPIIFQIEPQRVDNEICTMIKYTSQISIKDTLALAAENKALNDFCRANFAGIDHEVPFIFYRAFNELPTDSLATPYFGFVRPLDPKLP